MWLRFLPLLLNADALPAGATAARKLDTVEVRVGRLRQVDAFATPAAVSVVRLGEDASRPGVNLAEVLGGVPGLLARDRQNFAQDTQLSIRGHGARASFGVRGLRLYSDGIPATQPDGQGQLSHFNLLAGDRVEILRGPFSALYGNAAGGVLQLWSALPQSGAPPELRAQASLGPGQTRNAGLRLLAHAGAVGFNASASAFETAGWRDHSAARRRHLQWLAAYDPAAVSVRATVLLQHFDAPDAEDPLGLTGDQVRADPRQAPLATQFDTRKSARQDQVGLRLDHAPGNGHSAQLQTWAGRRRVEQFLAIPVAVQSSAQHAGGVIDLDGDYAGADLRWSWSRNGLEWTLGWNIEGMRQRRRGFENFVGNQLGVRGALRRDELNRVRGSDGYAQVWWRFAPRWSLLAGLRDSRTDFGVQDAYIHAGNPDDSGSRVYHQATPVLGLGFTPAPAWHLHLALGRGFETPTFNELGYRADGGAGLALELAPARSRNAELGLKWQAQEGWEGQGAARLQTLELALFRGDTDDELVVARNLGGRSSFRNIGRTRRSGVEFTSALTLSTHWRLDLALTQLKAQFRDAFPLCVAAGCSTPNVLVAAGTPLPGLPRRQAYGRLTWQSPALSWEAALEGRAVGAVSANDAGTAHAPGYGLLDLELSRRFGASGQWRGWLRIDNLRDHSYIGSVIVNEANARYFEPGPGRRLWLGLTWAPP